METKLHGLLTPHDVAERLSISTQRLLKMARAGEIPFLRVGDEIRFDQSELVKWLATNSQGATHAK